MRYRIRLLSPIGDNVYIVIFVVIVIFIWWSPFIPNRNLYDIFTYNHMTLMYFEAALMLRHPWF